MIPIKEMRKSIEKTAGPAGKAVWKGIGSTFKLMGKYPKTTIALAAGTAGAIALADKIHPLHQMVREETKNKLMKEQNVILKDILRSKKEVAVEPKKKKLITPPLT